MCLALAACSTQPARLPEPPPLIFSGSGIEVADVEVLEVTPEMDAFLEEHVLPYRRLQNRLNQLNYAIREADVLGFRYDARTTLTAAEAFASRSGNCIAFANMYVALARRAGLDAWYQEVSMQPEWSSEDDTLLIAKHINIVVEAPHRSYVIDVTDSRIEDSTVRREISDQEGTALYFNNLGAEALLANDLPTAHAYLVKSIRTAPHLPDAWSNLGVVYSRNGQFREAELAYQTAMANDPREYASMANLHDLYLNLGMVAEAAVLARKVEEYRRDNPYYLLKLSEEALAQQHYDESIRLLRRAIRQKDDEHLLHFAMARALFLSGDLLSAEESFAQARQLAPEEAALEYDRPLAELLEAAAEELD
jgi:tetratricopeptide (TPR) repeat protein